LELIDRDGAVGSYSTTALTPKVKRMAARKETGLVKAIGIDLRRLHAAWMEIVFPRQRNVANSFYGKYTPDTTVGMVGYRLWGLLGAMAVGVAYPLAVAGFATRFYSRRVNWAVARLGIVGVVLVSVLAWGGLTVVAVLGSFSRNGIVAVGAAGGVATVSAALAVVFSRVGGRGTTVVFAYPFGVTAVFLPPVVAAFYSPTLADLVFTGSETLAEMMLDAAGDAGTYLRREFELVGVAYVGMWFGISVPVGWGLGVLTTLANLVRPAPDRDDED
jgi:hypothetical protein